MLDHLYQGRINHDDIRCHSCAQTPFGLSTRLIRCHFPGYSVMYLRSTHSPTSLSPAPVHAGYVASACPPGFWLSVPPASAPDLQASHNNFATLAQNDGGWREEGSRG